MLRIAVIGTGIAGMGCGYFLHRDNELTFYEQNPYVGGHTNTIVVQESERPVYIDTGFMVYNEGTYPNLTRLFRELQVPSMPTSMSFSVQHVPSGLEFCGSGISGMFAQRKNLLSPSFMSLLGQIHRFNKESVGILEDIRYSTYSLNEYVRERGYGEEFLHKYLIPMSSAVWSTPPDRMLGFPAMTLVRFFKNHGFLGLDCQHTWRTIVNGSQAYREKLIAPFRGKIYTNRAAVKVVRDGTRVTVRDSQGGAQTFDKVILACHADQALRLLENPTGAETRLLSEFKYQNNRVALHTDACVMPKTRRAWSSWNYRIEMNGDGSLHPSTIYYMNSLQKVSDRRDYFVSINDSGKVDPGRVLLNLEYEHPVFSLGAIRAQRDLTQLNWNGHVYFCGSYFKYGFHEDAFASALDLCRNITGQRIWQ